MTMTEKNLNSLNIDQMNIKQLRDTVKALTLLMTFEADRVTALQERVLALEVKNLQLEERTPPLCDHAWGVDIHQGYAPKCLKCGQHPKLTMD